MDQYKRDWLNRYIPRKRALIRLYQKLDHKRADACSLHSPTISGMPKARRSSSMIEDRMAEVDLLERRIARLEKAADKIKWEILTAIDELGDPVHAEILERHFIDGETVEAIADELGFSDRHCWRLYTAAVSEIEVPPDYKPAYNSQPVERSQDDQCS